MKTRFSITAVSKLYRDEKDKTIEALKNVSVEVKEKEFIVIVGPSGCGKTTLLKIAAGLIAPTTGKILLNGKVVDKPSKEKGLVFQHPYPFPWLTVFENVEFGLKHLPADKIQAVAQYLIDQVGLSGFENSFVKILSGGMKQRVVIATVLANDPDILLMDEPFSALDQQTRSLMQELVLSIWRETKKAVLFVTHDIEEAIFLADKVYVMSSKPGTIKDIVRVELSRPRTPDMKLSAEFLRIKKHISYVIRGEAIKAAGVKLAAIRPKALKLGLHTWPGNIPFYLAEQTGLYKKHSLEVELMSQEKEEDRIAALQNGDVDVLNLTADAAIIAKERGLNLQLFLCINKSVGADAILVKKGIKNIEQLKGKKIAIEKGWVSHFFLLYVLDLHDLKESDVTVVYMKGSDIGSALIQGKVAAAVLWEPWLTQARKLSGTKILISTKDEPVIYDVLVTTKKIAKQKRQALQKLSRVWFESLHYISRNRDRATQLMSIPLGVSAKELEQQLQDIRFLDLSDNKKLLGTHTKKGNLQLKRMAEVWSKNEVISGKVEVDDMITHSFIM